MELTHIHFFTSSGLLSEERPFVLPARALWFIRLSKKYPHGCVLPGCVESTLKLLLPVVVGWFVCYGDLPSDRNKLSRVIPRIRDLPQERGIGMGRSVDGGMYIRPFDPSPEVYRLC